jgi:hypothetical protein
MPNAIFLNDCDHYLNPLVLHVDCTDDLAGYLSGHVESISTTSDFGPLTFWFAPTRHPVPRDVNRSATELLLAATRQCHARTAPFIRGRVVLTAHDGRGELANLTQRQITQIAAHRTGPLAQWVLDWRYAADARAVRARRNAHRHAVRT